MARESAAVRGSDAALYFQSFDEGAAEMWSRWDMQSHAPDLLITNYSMLNIMLMRSIEMDIFIATRDWLEEGRRLGERRMFHLVVDELHTYRGTPGTEVAYLLRVLLDRLGLGPESEQLRIIASSASLESDDEKAREYLEEFFGRNRARFEIVEGRSRAPDASAIRNCQMFASGFRDFGRAMRDAPDGIESYARSLAHSIGIPETDGESGRVLHDVVLRSEAGEAVRAICNPNGSFFPKSHSQIAEEVFSALPESERAEAAEGFLVCLSAANPAPVRLRAHMFFRSVQGMWACCDPQCSEAHRQEAIQLNLGLAEHVRQSCCGLRCQPFARSAHPLTLDRSNFLNLAASGRGSDRVPCTALF